MGIWDSFGKNGIQLKISKERRLRHFKIGDKADIPDGVYIGHCGVVVIHEGIFIADYPTIIDKWGRKLIIHLSKGTFEVYKEKK